MTTIFIQLNEIYLSFFATFFNVSLWIIYNQFLQLSKLIKDVYPSSSVKKGRFQKPKIIAIRFLYKTTWKFNFIVRINWFILLNTVKTLLQTPSYLCNRFLFSEFGRQMIFVDFQKSVKIGLTKFILTIY